MSKSIQFRELWDELYARNREAWLTVSSGSMTPTMRIGDRVLVKQAAPQQICFGDVIVFQEADRLIIHRVISRQVNDRHIMFLQKGDSSIFAAGVSAESVIGKAVCIRRGDRYIRLDGLLGRCMNVLLAVNSYFLYAFHRRRLASRLARGSLYCLNILFLMR